MSFLAAQLCDDPALATTSDAESIQPSRLEGGDSPELKALGGYHGWMDDDSIIGLLRAFVAERDWGQFHTPENLAKSIVIEAAELLECFQWHDSAAAADIQGELADVMTYCLLLADRLGVDPQRIILDKLESTRRKYPVEKAHGRSTKYDRL